MNKYDFDRHLVSLGVCRGDRVLVAVSGGMDSMCLLHGLYNSSLMPECSVAHVNFHLRGTESDGDECAVREWCAGNRVELFVKDVDTVAYSNKYSVSIEMAARDLRYAWFEELMRGDCDGGFKYLAIAHNANDNAETLMLNLVRGTGVKGLCGIAQKNGAVIRPLLGYTRDEIEKYVCYFKIPYRIDRTNLENDFARNRIRNEVFPHLKKINPSVVHTLNRNINYFSMANDILEAMLMEKRRVLLKTEMDGAGYQKDALQDIEGQQSVLKDDGVAPFRPCSPFLHHSCLHLVIDELLMESQWPYWLYMILQEYGFNPAQVEDIAASLCGMEVKRYLSGSYVVVKERGLLKIYPVRILDILPDILIHAPGEFLFGDVVISLELVANSDRIQEQMRNPANGLFVSADHLSFPLTCRPMRPGDKFTPFGMRGAKKVSDFFTDIKIDHICRSRVPVLQNGNAGAIICLPGFRLDARFAVTSDTERVLVVKSRLSVTIQSFGIASNFDIR
ncbi:MAG: tRNA lysidine(34) synthetase TilS [Bacteroidales bacterium]